jgi:hypothetical protein
VLARVLAAVLKEKTLFFYKSNKTPSKHPLEKQRTPINKYTFLGLGRVLVGCLSLFA